MLYAIRNSGVIIEFFKQYKLNILIKNTMHQNTNQNCTNALKTPNINSFKQKKDITCAISANPYKQNASIITHTKYAIMNDPINFSDTLKFFFSFSIFLVFQRA